MNNFTKEELQFLLDLITYQSAENSNGPLEKKIQSMINKYDEPKYCDVSGIKINFK